MRAIEAYLNISKDLIKNNKLYCIKIDFEPIINVNDIKIYNNIWMDKSGYKNGIKMGWGDWLIDAVFPRYLYNENEKSILKMLKDKRLYDKPSFSKRSSCHSHFGRMCRPRKIDGSKYIGYMDYTIDRWKRENHKASPSAHS